MTLSSSLVLAVAAGSAAGGVARYLLSGAVHHRISTTFPLGTLLVNVLGCLALGFIMQIALDAGELSPSTRALLTTGFCGGFTTFSTFSWETIALIEEGSLRRAALNAGGSVLLGLGAIWLGTITGKLVLGLLRKGGA
jgi:CrcB protein